MKHQKLIFQTKANVEKKSKYICSFRVIRLFILIKVSKTKNSYISLFRLGIESDEKDKHRKKIFGLEKGKHVLRITILLYTSFEYILKRLSMLFSIQKQRTL